MVLKNSHKTKNNYDSLNRLLNLETKKGTDTLTGFTYTLSPTGMRTSVTEQDGRKVEYKYDSLYRLTEEKITDAVNGDRVTTYSMDAVGNRTSKVDSVDGTTTYVYDNNDRLLSETKGSDVSSYIYDNNGNTESKTKGTDITLYEWDDRGRLVEVQNPNSDAVSYEYNEKGIRVSSTINGVKTSFLLDTNRNYAQVLEEYTSSGVQVAYVYGHDLISQNRSGAKSFYLYDGLGTTKALTDSSGVVTDRYIYDAYGNILSSTGTTQNSYLYTGEQFDKNLGQYYLRDRYYSQGVGRFTRSDTWEGDYNNPLSLNKYLYTHGNPINAIDPSGQFSIQEVAATIAISGILSALSYVLPSQVDVAQKTKVELHYFNVATSTSFSFNIGLPLFHIRIVLVKGLTGFAFDGDPFPKPAQPSSRLAILDKNGEFPDSNGKKLKLNDSLYTSKNGSQQLSNDLPYEYLLQTVRATAKWVNDQRFRYVIGTKMVNSNSFASQALSDIGYSRTMNPLALGWGTDLRGEQSNLERI